MTLLMNYNDPRLLEVAQKIFIEQFKRDPKLEVEMDDRRKKLMYDDVLYNLSHLLTQLIIMIRKSSETILFGFTSCYAI